MGQRFERDEQRFMGRDEHDRPPTQGGDWRDREEGNARGNDWGNERFASRDESERQRSFGRGDFDDRGRGAFGYQSSSGQGRGYEMDREGRGRGQGFGGYPNQRDHGNYGNGPWGGQVERGGEWRGAQGGMGRLQGTREERWGMGNSSDESDRFRQGSENRYLGSGWGGDERFGGERGAEGNDRAWSERQGQTWGGAYATGTPWYGRQTTGGESWTSGQRWNAQQRGQYFGKGPKGYKRSDERIKEDVSERLSLGHIDASDVEVQVKDGEVTLSGTVPTRGMKRIAEEIIEELAGVRDVTNQLRVKRDEQGQGERASGNGGDMNRRASNDKNDKAQPYHRS